MKKLGLIICLICTVTVFSFGQARLENVKSKQFKTTRGFKLKGDVGYLIVPENRNNPSSREVKLKYVHLKSLSETPVEPVIFLEGGGGESTWQIDSPKDLSDWIEILEVADLIFLDRRGATDESLNYIWRRDFPENFFVSEVEANKHYQKMSVEALSMFEEKNIDITGYNIEEHAQDVDDFTNLLGFDRYNLFGFSFGSHIGMTVMKLFPEKINRAILVGADAIDQSLNFPSYLDTHINKIDLLIKKDSALTQAIPDLNALINKVMDKLEKEPATVTVKNPLTGKDINVKIGPFGLAIILRLDIDDANDIPVIPRLLYSIDKGDYSMLTWFVQKRVVYSLAIPGGGINQQLASGASSERWERILMEAKESPFGNAMNFPFSGAKDHWIETELSFDPSIPLKTDIPTLFISGTLDARTPVEQVEKTRMGFTSSVHVRVKNAGHEQVMWDAETCNESIPAFLLGKEVTLIDAYYDHIKFLPLEGPSSGHPSMK